MATLANEAAKIFRGTTCAKNVERCCLGPDFLLHQIEKENWAVT